MWPEPHTRPSQIYLGTTLGHPPLGPWHRPSTWRTSHRMVYAAGVGYSVLLHLARLLLARRRTYVRAVWTRVHGCA